MRIFDTWCGPIDTLLFDRLPPVGSLISYNHTKQQTIHVVRNQHIIAYPSLVTLEDIFFFHHILEICYWFIPLFCHDYAVITLLKTLYNTPSIPLTAHNKTIFLFKLLTIIGIYPDIKDVDYHYALQHFTEHTIESLIKSSISRDIMHNLNAWIVICLQAHPDISKFKTMKFFKESILS